MDGKYGRKTCFDHIILEGETQVEPKTGNRTEYELRFVPVEKPMRVEFNGGLIAESSHALLLHESRHQPVYYFPRGDVRMDLLEKTDLTTHCPYKGDACYWTLKVNGEKVENVVWSYPEPYAEAAALKDYMAFYADKVSILPASG